MELIKRAWRGEEKLWKVYWLYFWVVSIALSIVVGMLTIVIPMLEVPNKIFNFVYLIWVTVAIWRCAFNVKHKLWGYLARVFNPVGLFVLGLLLGGILVGQDLIKAAECRRETAQYMRTGGTDAEAFKKECTLRKQGKIAEDGNKLKPAAVESIMEQFIGCWQVPAQAKNTDNPVTLSAKWAEDGNLVDVVLAKDNERYASDPWFREVADSAIKAVRACAPLKNMPADKFDKWKEMLLIFDPRDEPSQPAVTP